MAAFSTGHALTIGVGADLPNTIDDAGAVADILADPARCAYDPAKVRRLLGPEATATGIICALEALAKEELREATLVIYFSGHGYRVHGEAGETYYLMPHGYDLANLRETALAASVFTELVNGIKAKRLLLLLDSCHAGGIEQAKWPFGRRVPPPTPSAVPDKALKRLATGKGRIALSSSRGSEISLAGRPYSAFTLALLEALSGQSTAQEDGFVRASDLAMYAARVLPERTKDRQHPVFEFYEADNFPVAYYAAGDTVPKGLPFKIEPEVEIQPGDWRPWPTTVITNQPNWTVTGPVTIVHGDATQNTYRSRPRDDGDG